MTVLLGRPPESDVRVLPTMLQVYGPSCKSRLNYL